MCIYGFIFTFISKITASALNNGLGFYIRLSGSGIMTDSVKY